MKGPEFDRIVYGDRDRKLETLDGAMLAIDWKGLSATATKDVERQFDIVRQAIEGGADRLIDRLNSEASGWSDQVERPAPHLPDGYSVDERLDYDGRVLRDPDSVIIGYYGEAEDPGIITQDAYNHSDRVDERRMKMEGQTNDRTS